MLATNFLFTYLYLNNIYITEYLTNLSPSLPTISLFY